MRDKLINIFLLVFVFIAMLLVTEVIYRLWMGIPLQGNTDLPEDGTERISTFQKSKNDLLVYELKAYASTRYMNVNNTINSFGIRDREYQINKPKGTFRIVVLGDSVIYGFALENNDTFPRHLERQLGEGYEVINFGVPGYSTIQEIEFYKTRVKKFNPDLIILGYSLNDAREASWEIHLFKHTFFSYIQKSYFLRDLKSFLNYGVYLNQTNIYNDFKKLRHETGELPVVVIIFPNFQKFENYPYEDLHKKIVDAAQDNDLNVLDLFDTYSKYDSDSVHLHKLSEGEPEDPEDWDFVHPNSLGNKIAADAVYSYLMENNFLFS